MKGEMATRISITGRDIMRHGNWASRSMYTDAPTAVRGIIVLGRM
jgi:hypothetical protein